MKSHQNPLWISEGDPTGISYELLEKSYDNLFQLSQNIPIFLVRSQNTFLPNFFLEHSIQTKLPKNGLYYINSKYFNQFKDHSFELGYPDTKSGLCSYFSYYSIVINLDNCSVKFERRVSIISANVLTTSSSNFFISI